MPDLKSATTSSVGKKVVMALTGLALFVFLVFHLGENLLLLKRDADLYNAYAHYLHKLEPLIVVAEIFLLAFFVFHIVSGVSVAVRRRRARPEGYQRSRRAGGPSKRNLSSTTMIFTGLLLLVFVVVHLLDFKYGPGIEEGYVTEIHGETGRDLYRLVAEEFSEPLDVAFYVGCMVFLGFHLRHGFWSAFQSLGVHHPRLTPVIYATGVVLAILLAAGFLLLPLWLFFLGAGGGP